MVAGLSVVEKHSGAEVSCFSVGDVAARDAEQGQSGRCRAASSNSLAHQLGARNRNGVPRALRVPQALAGPGT